MTPAATRPLYAAVLVPALQEIQREFGYLKREALEDYSQKSGMPLYRLQAVASFFPHFLLSPPRRVTLRVCRDMACHMAGSTTMLRELDSLAGERVAIEGVSCLGRCDRAPAASVSVKGSEHECYYLARSADELKEIVGACLGDAPPAFDHDADQSFSTAGSVIDPYVGKPRDYAGVRKVIATRDRLAAIRELRVNLSAETEVVEEVRGWVEDEWTKGAEPGGWSEALLNELKDADLRGMGGAGIPATQKWRDVRDAVMTARQRKADDRAFIVVNGDESEPGTFKDRELLLRYPHLIIEGVILAGLITEASQGFIYIRHEYIEQVEACRAEIQRAEQLGFCGKEASVLGRPFPISVFVSPGGYICGEQSALIEAMSDRRGEPRNLPPKLETNGLEDLPTLVSNVETFAWVPYICINGGKAYAKQGVNGWQGRRWFSVSGDVKRRGVYEVPMGLTLRELIYGEQYCRGVAGDRKLKGVAPSGPSGGFLPAKLTAKAGLPRDHLNNKAWQELARRRGFDPTLTELDILDLELELNLFRALSPTQALGAGLVVYAEGRDMLEQALNAAEFFRNESCGKCVPCRLGSQKLVSLVAQLMSRKINAERWNDELLPLIEELDKTVTLASICGLGRSVPVPLRTAIHFFENDVANYLSPNERAAASKAEKD